MFIQLITVLNNKVFFLAIGLRKIKLVLIWKSLLGGQLSECWKILCKLPEKKGYQQSYPTINPTNYDDWLNKICSWCNHGANALGETNRCLIGLKACSREGNLCLAWKT